MPFGNGVHELGEVNADNGSKPVPRSQDRELSKDHDRDELQRLGKKQVLRVCPSSEDTVGSAPGECSHS